MKKYIIFLLIITVVFWNCSKNAPRDNPFDPKSTSYNSKGALKGVVKNLADTPVGGALIQSDIGNYSTTSLPDGSFEINNIEKGTYTFTVSEAQYSDSVYIIEIPQNTTVEKTLYLELGTPILISPVDRFTYTYNFGTVTVTNIWYSVAGAEKYEVAISTNNDMVFDITNVVLTTNFIQEYTESTNYWKVRPIKGTKSGPWSEIRKFNVYLQPS